MGFGRWHSRAKKAQQLRELLAMIQQHDGDSVIVSTHSHKIKQIMNEVDKFDKEVIDKMTNLKMLDKSQPNGSISRIRLGWKRGTPVIVDADMVYDPSQSVKDPTAEANRVTNRPSGPHSDFQRKLRASNLRSEK